jgi:hypothetical protein
MGITIRFAKRSKVYCGNAKHVGLVLALSFLVLITGCGESKDTALVSKSQPAQQAVLQLNPQTISSESGFAFAYPVPQLVGEADIAGQENRSPYGLMEDGKLLTPSHSIHDDIRKNGKGRWSHWGQGIYFSSSDGTDPRQNKRKYVLVK